MFYKLVKKFAFWKFLFRSLLNLFWHISNFSSVTMLALRLAEEIRNLTQNNLQNQLDLIYRTFLL